MSSGLPVVVSDWNGYRELVEHGKQGFRAPTVWGRLDNRFLNLVSELHDPLSQFYLGQSTAIDMEKLFSYVESLLINAELSGRMSEDARKRALELYSWKSIIRQYEALWTELTEKAEHSKDQPSSFLSMDFQHDFGGYPTQLLSEDHKVRLTDEGRLLIQKDYDLAYYRRQAASSGWRQRFAFAVNAKIQSLWKI